MVEGEEFDYITRTVFNRGIWGVTGVIDEQAINLPMTFSLELMNCTFFYREKPWYAGQFVKKIIPLNNEVCVHWRYFEVVLNKLQAKLKSVLVRDVDDTFLNATICLPIKRSVNDITHKYHDNGLVPDWEYMQKYVSKIEEETKARVDKYLVNAGLDKIPTADELKILKNEKKLVKFRVGKLFDIHPTKAYKLLNDDIFVIDGINPVMCNSEQMNGVGGYSNLDCTEKAGTITFSDTTTGGNTIFYQDSDFIGYSHVQGMYSFDWEHWNSKCCFYFVTALRQASGVGFDYATKYNRKLVSEFEVCLPVQKGLDSTRKYHDEGYVPDWDYMERYIDVLMRQTVARVM